jgi:peptide/nickel transport system substrate-binding protein
MAVWRDAMQGAASVTAPRVPSPRGRTTRFFLVALAVLTLPVQVAGQSPATAPSHGGTLRVARPEAPYLPPYSDPTALDPVIDPLDAYAIHRCCLSRTLLGHDGRSAREGGAAVHPDAAASLPTISLDGLEWTFHLRDGLRYGPPFEDVPISAADFVRGFHRALAPETPGSGYPAALFSAIEGAPAYAGGHASAITGLEAPDDRTLVIRLTEPSGALEARLATPLILPIPANPCGPDAPLGIYQGHAAGIGTFVVSSGPYMLEGADGLDFCRPSDEQEPVPVQDGGASLHLLRNPSWDPATDDLRPAYPDRIEFTARGSVDDRVTDVLEDRADLLWNSLSFRSSVPSERIPDFGPDRTFVDDAGVVMADYMNLALPPFDDIHVRRAVNHAIDKTRVVEAFGGPYSAAPVGHIAPDGLLDGLLLGWDPYAAADGHADLEGARAEMAMSRYDADGDGVCDATACRNVRALTRDFGPEVAQGGEDPFRAITDAATEDLARIGIDLAVERVPPDQLVPVSVDPQERIPIVIGVGWVGGELNASSYVADAFHSRTTDDTTNGTLVGATPEQLAEWGYDGVQTPNVDARINACLPLTGSAQFECWAGLDQYMTLEVVPWIPLVVRRNVSVAGPNVRSYSWDELSHTPAFDRIAVGPAPD